MAGKTSVWEQGPEKMIYPMACWAGNRTSSLTLQLSSSLPKTLLSPLDQELNKPQALAVPYNNSLPRSTTPSSRDGHTAEPQDRQEMFLWTGCTPSHGMRVAQQPPHLALCLLVTPQNFPSSRGHKMPHQAVCNCVWAQDFLHTCRQSFTGLSIQKAPKSSHSATGHHYI